MYKVNDIIQVEVKWVVEYGAFCSIIEPIYDDQKWAGLIHISEISDYYVSNIDDFFKVGDKFACKVTDIVEEKKHLKLSFKAIRPELLKNSE
ncbi:S1 RNA-binding domain-containing protein [Spiroplasma endosymbiont of Aspidapion aeneum]|uniref:S1 RNA-binding domain-containing protein n=1 Tax=Spiroplasma endosymbiont of Aspidapion aeneum TaxID=3066276 RepID=UPI00313C81B1